MLKALSKDQCEESADNKNKSLENLNSINFKFEMTEKWAFDYVYLKLMEKKDWIQVYFNHKLYNGGEIIKICDENSTLIMHNLQHYIDTSEGERASCFQLPNFEIETRLLKNAIGSNFMFHGKRRNPKEIIEFFFNTSKDIFYIPIDMSHIFNQDMILRYTFCPSKTFEENWNEVRRIKKNENNFLLENENWKNYLTPLFSWISVVSYHSNNYKPYFNHYSYDPENIQGVSISMDQNNSHWTFSFLKYPELMHTFIEHFELKSSHD